MGQDYSLAQCLSSPVHLRVLAEDPPLPFPLLVKEVDYKWFKKDGGKKIKNVS